MLALRVLRQALAVVVTVVLVRVLSQEEFGRYQFIVTVAGLCCAFTLPGMQRAIIQSVARGHAGTFTAGTRLTLRFSFLGAAVLLAVAAASLFAGLREQAWAFAIAGVLFPAAYGLNQWQSLQIGKRDFRSNTLRSSAAVIVSSLALIAAGLTGHQSLPVLVTAAFGVLAVQNVYQQHRAARSVGPDETVESGSIAYGLRSSLWEGINILANWIDRLFLFALGSPHLLAAYAVADRIPEVIKANMNDAMFVLIPRFARQEGYTRRLARRFNLIGAGAAVLIIGFALVIVPWLIPLLYTDGYQESILLCQLLLVSIAVHCFAIVKNAYIGAKLDVASVRSITIGSSIVRIVTSAVLVWRFGALGAAISTIVYRVATLGFVQYCMRKYRGGQDDAARP